MTFGQFVSILRARWLSALLTLVLIFGGTVAGSLLWPKKYTATASVVVDVKPDPVSAMIYPGMTSPAFMATQVDVIQSDRVALRVVRNLRLAESPQFRTQWRDETDGQGNIETWLAEMFQTSMDVKPSRESNVINVSYKAADPQVAAALANAFVKAYIDTTLEMRVDPARLYSTFFDTRSKEAREALEKAQSKLSAFQRDNGIIASDERLDVENARLNELSSQLVALEAVRSESSSRQAQVQGSGDRLQEVLTNPLVASLRGDLTRNEARLQELNARYGENHPQVVEAKANITELRSRIEAETRRITGGVGVSNNINRQREAQTRAELESQRAKVLKLKQVRDEGSVLQRDVESAQRSYDAVLARLNQSSLESQANQSNVSVLTQASAPSRPSSPRLLINTLLGLILGAFAALVVALLRELMDRRVRAHEDIHGALGIPVIGIMPRPRERKFIGSQSELLMKQRVLGRLPPPSARGT